MGKGGNTTVQLGFQEPRWLKHKRTINLILLSILPVFAILYQMIFPQIGFFMYYEVYTMLFVGLCQFLVYLNYPMNRKNKSKSEYQCTLFDIALGFIGLIASFYVAFNWEEIYVLGSVSSTLAQQVLGWVFILVVLESARRAVGLPLVVVAILFLIYTASGNNIPGMFHTAKFNSGNIIGYVYLSTMGIFGSPNQIISGMVMAFTTFGAFLQITKAGEFYLKISLALMGRLRGGAAKVAIFCSMLFSTMTGEPMSNIGIIAPMSLPLMKRQKYDPVFSGATVAVASCGSMIMPPVMGAVAFLMGEMTGLGYPAVMMGAIIPAVLYYIALYFQVDFYAAKKGYKPLEAVNIPKVGQVLKEGWYFLLPVVVLVLFLIVFRFTATSSVYYATFSLLIIGLLKKSDRDSFVPRIKEVFPTAGRSILSIIAVTSASGIIMASVTLTGIGLRLSALLTYVSGGSLVVLAFLTAVTIYIMGMGMAPIVSYILMAILVAPALTGMGVPVLVAHFFILYMSVSGFITPPVALASYVTGAMVGEDGMKIGFKAMRLGIICYLLPFVSLFAPALMLIGTVPEIVLSVITAIIGVVALAAALEGYMLVDVPIWQRIMFLVAGVMFFIPGEVTDLIGLATIIIPLYFQIIAHKAKKSNMVLGCTEGTQP